MSDDNMASNRLWGIDLGGTKIEGVVLESAEQPEVECRIRINTEGDQGYQHVLNQITALVDTMACRVGGRPKRIGIGTPGAIDQATGLLKGSNSQHLAGKPLDQDLAHLLGIPVFMANDANCFALAETRMGAVQEIMPQANIVFGVILGTGVGGGVVFNGKVMPGLQRIAGEWGHNFLDQSGGNCHCGKVGCVEQLISGPALEDFYEKLTHERKPLQEIDRSARAGDANAKATMQRLVHFFGLGISVVINILDPDIIVIGGGVGNIDLLYSHGPAEAARHIFSPRMETRFIKPKLGDSAGVFGAAFLVV